MAGRKRTTSKQEKALIEFPSSYRIVAADQSLKRPGFFKCLVTKTDNSLIFSELDAINVDNKKATKPHGQILDEIHRTMLEFFPDESDNTPIYYIREKLTLGSMPMAMLGMAKVHGLTDLYLWTKERTWQELPPMTVKKVLTGKGKAEKSEVAEALKAYLGNFSFSCDDESDAAAVAIAWLIQQNQLQTFMSNSKNNNADKGIST